MNRNAGTKHALEAQLYLSKRPRVVSHRPMQAFPDYSSVIRKAHDEASSLLPLIIPRNSENSGAEFRALEGPVRFLDSNAREIRTPLTFLWESCVIN